MGKVTPAMAAEMKRMFNNGVSQMEIALIYGVSQATVYKHIHNKAHPRKEDNDEILLKAMWRKTVDELLKKVKDKQYVRRKSDVCNRCIYGGLSGRQVCIRPGCKRGS